MAIKMTGKKEWKLLWPFYAFTFLIGIVSVSMPFYIIFYQNRGFSLTQISVLFAVMAITRLLSEVPTGVIADVFGRRVSSIAGFFLTSFIWIFVPLASSSYFALILLMVLLAISQTLISGAYEAWVYDWLKQNKAKKLISEFYAKTQTFGYSGLIIGPFIGGLLASVLRLDWLFIIDGVGGALLCVILLLFTKEKFKKVAYNVKRNFKQILNTAKKGFKFILSAKKFKLMMVAGASFAGWGAIGELAKQPFLVNLGMPISYLGFFFSILGVFVAIAPLLGVKLLKNVSERKVFATFALSVFLLSLLILFARAPYYLYGAMILIIIEVIFLAQMPLFNAHIQHLLPSKTRATILSTQNMAEEVIYGIAMVAGGIVMTVLSPKIALVLSGFFMLPALISFLLMRK